MKKYKKVIALISIVSISCFLYSCETWRSECTGQIIVENEIPDITLYVGGESYFRDLFSQPVVLSHTENRKIITTFLIEDLLVVNASRERSEVTGRLHAIEITPLKAGETKITVIAEDGCDYNIQTSFNVTVLDTTSS